MPQSGSNPFSSPVLPNDRHSSPPGTPGPWRDRHFLVLHPYEAKLPAVCIKTGSRKDVTFDLHELPFRSLDEDYGEFTLKIDIPLSNGYRRMWVLVCVLVPLLGCVHGCSGIVLMLADPGELPQELSTAIGLTGVGLLVSGLAFGAWWFCQPVLRPVLTGRPYIWLSGACRAFLEELPPLHEDLQSER